MDGPAAVAQEQVPWVNQQATAILDMFGMQVAPKRMRWWHPYGMCGSDELMLDGGVVNPASILAKPKMAIFGLSCDWWGRTIGSAHACLESNTQCCLQACISVGIRVADCSLPPADGNT